MQSPVPSPGLNGKRIGFVSTRIAGTDGVSLEIEKWAAVLKRLGVECYYIAGECDRPAEVSAVIERAHFTHPEIAEISEASLAPDRRDSRLTDLILENARLIRNGLNRAIDEFSLDAIIAQNLSLIHI